MRIVLPDVKNVHEETIINRLSSSGPEIPVQI